MATRVYGGEIFSQIKVSGQPNVDADSDIDILTLIAGSNITLTTDATNDTVTISTTGLANQTHTGDATGATALTVVGINNTLLSGLATGILKNTTTTGVPSIAIASDFPTLNQSTTGNAATVTTNANLTGVVTSVGNGTAIADAALSIAKTSGLQGALDLKAPLASPSFTTPTLGVASATSLATSAATPLLLTNGQLVNIALTSQTVGATTLTIPNFASVVDTFVFTTLAQTLSNKIFVAPALGTPISGVATNLTGTAAGLTAGNVTTNANLTGDVTSVGNAATVVKINGTTMSGLATGILKNTTTTGIPSIAIASDFPTLNQNTTGSSASCTGNAATVTTNANLTGVVTSVGNATAIADAALSIAKTSGLQTALDAKAPLASPTFTTQIITPLVIGGTATTADLTLQTTSGVGAAGADMHFLVGNNGATEAMSILNSGNVGIGTTVPGEKLQVAGAVKVTGNIAVDIASAGAMGYGDRFRFVSWGANGATQGAYSFEGFASDGSLNQEYMRIDSNGNVGIGTIPSARLHTTGTVRFQNFGAGTATFDASGNISSVSDERLKTILGSFNKGLDEILQINPILHKWNETSGMEMENIYAGLSAQNVAQWIPEAASINGDGMLGVSDRVIIAALINAVKELSAEVDILKTKSALPIDHSVIANNNLINLVKTKDARSIEIMKPPFEDTYEVVEKEENGKLISITQLKKGYREDKNKNIFRMESQAEAENRRQLIINSIKLT